MEKPLACCLKCSAPLPPRFGGRPADYCSTVCRRAAEFEVRRINRRLERLEEKRSGLRVDLAAGQYGPVARQHSTRRLAAVDQEIERAEARLRELLTAAAGGPEAA